MATSPGGVAQPDRRIAVMTQDRFLFRLDLLTRRFRVPASAGGASAVSSALKIFKVIVFARAAPPEGGTPCLYSDVPGGNRFALWLEFPRFAALAFSTEGS